MLFSILFKASAWFYKLLYAISLIFVSDMKIFAEMVTNAHTNF